MILDVALGLLDVVILVVIIERSIVATGFLVRLFAPIVLDLLVIVGGITERAVNENWRRTIERADAKKVTIFEKVFVALRANVVVMKVT
jgi:hypothetical protein